MSGHLDGPPPGPPDPPYIPGDLGAPSAEEFARRRASPTPEERNPYAPSPDWKPGQDTFTAQAAGIWDEGYAAGLREANAYPQAWRYGAAEENARIVAALRGKGTHAADVLADQIESEAPAGRAAATPDPPDDWTAAILTLRRAMCTPAGREQVERELIRPFAASPDPPDEEATDG